VNVTFANVVFPAFLAPYAVSILTPWIGAVALGCEFVVLFAFQFRCAAWWLIIVVFLTANAVSGIIGFILFGFLIPDVPLGRAWLIALVPAYLLSVVIEYAVYRAFMRWRMLARPFLASVASNGASYLVIAFCVWRGWAH
jgi:hypothetical protein